MLAYMFPGQGSQSVGMGRELFTPALFPESLERQVDAIVGYSLRDMCLNGPEASLRKTDVTQPCLFVVNALAYLKRGAEPKPDFVAGHSLGEYNALFAAGAFDFVTGVRLVAARGKLMAAASGGGMAAVLGIDAQAVAAALKTGGLGTLDVANLNTPTQVVISGPLADIARAEAILTGAGAAAYIPLPVSAPFHSRYMAPAAADFAATLAEVDFQPLQLRVMANVTGRPYPEGATAETIRSLLAKQIHSSVLWAPSIAFLKARGVTRFEEIGPGTTLTRMLPQIPALDSRQLDEPREDAGPRPVAPPPAPSGVSVATPSASAVPPLPRRDEATEPLSRRDAPVAPPIARSPTPYAAVGVLPQVDRPPPRPANTARSEVEAPWRPVGAAETQPLEAPVGRIEAPVARTEAPVERTEAPADRPVPVAMARPVWTPPSARAAFAIAPESLGSAEFRSDYGVRMAYVAGAMFKGIASKELVIAMSRGGLLSFLGTGGMDLAEIAADIDTITAAVGARSPFGMNLLHNPQNPTLEDATVDLFLKRGIRNVEAAAYMTLSPALVRFRLSGFRARPDGTCEAAHRVIAKVSRPEVASLFMRPAPEQIVRRLRATGLITEQQAELSRTMPMADDICVESDSGGHTDGGVALSLLPAMLLLRDEIAGEYATRPRTRVGAAGGIGTPHAAAAAFIMGADFVLTGSINQCTVEAGTSDAVKDILETIEVQDTAYAPAGDMFEYGAKVQVVKKGVFFPSRANKLFDLYSRHGALEEIDAKTRQQIEEKFFKRSFDDVWRETKAYYASLGPLPDGQSIADIESRPKQKMALIFRWYFVHSNRLAMAGSVDQKVDYQIQCGPALGAFNQWVRGTPLEAWRERRVAEVAERVMQGTASLLAERMNQMAMSESVERVPAEAAQ